MKEQLKAFAKGYKTSKDISPGNAVIYNRVSSKEQEENQSLEHQLESCLKYAERYGLNIVHEPFGGTFESAKTDKERKEFNKMLTFIRRNKKLNIKYVIVYNTKRFSRTGSTTIIEELESMGILVLSTMSNYNPKTPAGKFCQRMELATANFENEEKGQTTRELGLAALLKGRWIGRAPRGYDQKTTKAKQTITINEEGKFIKKAFHWKADEKLTNEEIRQRLSKLGFEINKQKLSEVLKNPFYCGLMVHNFLNGEVVKGNHPPIISEEIFIRANEILNQKYTGGYEQKLEKDWAPLLGTLRCPCCNHNVSASMSTKMKKKYNREVYYYVCSRKGCRCNSQVVYVHEAFNNFLSNTTIKNLHQKVFETQLTKVFEGLTKENRLDIKTMKTEATKLTTQLHQLESNWALESHPKKKEILWGLIEDSEKKISKIESEISRSEDSILNLDNFLKEAIDLVYNPLTMWNKLNLGDKQRFQKLLFPEGILFDKKNRNIEPLTVNQFFIVNSDISVSYGNKKRELSDKNIKKSPYVPEVGLEPTQSQ